MSCASPGEQIKEGSSCWGGASKKTRSGQTGTINPQRQQEVIETPISCLLSGRKGLISFVKEELSLKEQVVH